MNTINVAGEGLFEAISSLAIEVPASDAPMTLSIAFGEASLAPAIHGAVRAWLHACQRGAFGSFSNEPPAHAATASKEERAGGIVYTVSGYPLHAGAFRSLARMLNYACLRHSPQARILRVVFSAPRAAERIDSPLALEQAAWIPAPAYADFPFVLRSGRDDALDSLVRIDLTGRTEQAWFAQMRATLLAWDAVVVRGAFVDDPRRRDVFMDSMVEPIEAQTYEASPTSIEHLLYEPVGSELGDHALLHMLHRLHRASPFIARVEIQ